MIIFYIAKKLWMASIALPVMTTPILPRMENAPQLIFVQKLKIINVSAVNRTISYHLIMDIHNAP
jgi:hypothetical protein